MNVQEPSRGSRRPERGALGSQRRPQSWESHPLHGSVALITGGAERVGACIAQTMAAAGAQVAINHLDEAGAAEITIDAITARDGTAIALQADISSPNEARALVQRTVDSFGRLDVVIHNASTYVHRTLSEITPEDLDRSLGAIVKGSLFVSQAAAAAMEEHGGTIMAIIGNSVTEAWPGYLTHSLAKAALKRLMENLAIELAPRVQCLTVSPGQLTAAEDSAQDIRAMRGEVREGGFVILPDGVQLLAGAAQDLADTVVLLAASPPYLTGADIRLDGGRSLY